MHARTDEACNPRYPKAETLRPETLKLTALKPLKPLNPLKPPKPRTTTRALKPKSLNPENPPTPLKPQKLNPPKTKKLLRDLILESLRVL